MACNKMAFELPPTVPSPKVKRIDVIHQYTRKIPPLFAKLSKRHKRRVYWGKINHTPNELTRVHQ